VTPEGETYEDLLAILKVEGVESYLDQDTNYTYLAPSDAVRLPAGVQELGLSCCSLVEACCVLGRCRLPLATSLLVLLPQLLPPYSFMPALPCSSPSPSGL